MVTLRRPLTLGLPWLLVIMESVYVMTGDLTLWNASSSPHILQITLWAVLLFPPLIILYTRWVYRVMRGASTFAARAGGCIEPIGARGCGTSYARPSDAGRRLRPAG